LQQKSNEIAEAVQQISVNYHNRNKSKSEIETHFQGEFSPRVRLMARDQSLGNRVIIRRGLPRGELRKLRCQFVIGGATLSWLSGTAEENKPLLCSVLNELSMQFNNTRSL
jgi:hypothetical protein